MHLYYSKFFCYIDISYTIDVCTSGFPTVNSSDGESGQGAENKVTTRLYPNLRFGCKGRVVRLIVAVVERENGQQIPKLQIWRQNQTDPASYFKTTFDIPVINDRSVCSNRDLNGGIFRCSLNEAYQAPVQPGDILGIELPPSNDVNLDIEFKTSETTFSPVYMFEGRLDSTVNISEGSNSSNGSDQLKVPQISLLVTLGTLIIFLIHLMYYNIKGQILHSVIASLRVESMLSLY